MLKKTISLIISVIMLCGVVSGTVSADAPLYFGGITNNILEQDFSEISSTSEVSDFTFYGDWICTGQFVTVSGDSKNSHIKTKKDIDLTDAEGYEFSAKAVFSWNSIGMWLAYDEATAKGYQIVVSSSNKLSLQKNGKTVAEGTLSSVYGVLNEYKVTVAGKAVTVSVNGSPCLTYTDTEEPNLKGIFGIESKYTADFAVMNIRLDKLSDAVTVNNWRYEKKFSSKDTVEAVAKEGITASGSSSAPIKFTDQYMQIGDGENAFSKMNFYYDKELSGDFTVEAYVATDYSNSYSIRFNEKDSSNYYDIYYNSTSNTREYKIRKVTGGNPEVLHAGSADFSHTTKVKHIIQVKDNGDKINVTATVYTSSDKEMSKTTADIAKENLYTKNHKIHIFMQSPGEYYRVYYFKAYSTPSGETKTKDVDLVNKTFVTGDTVESLKNIGIIVESEPESITTASDKYAYGHSKGKGIYWPAKDGSESVSYADTLSGDYTVSATSKVYQNQSHYYINYKDSKNYYEVEVRGSGVLVKKVAGGTENTVVPRTIDKSGKFNGFGCTTTINVKNNADGSLTLTVDANAPKEGYKASCSYTDNSPITSGIFRYKSGHATGDWNMLYDMKITKHETYTDVGAYEGKFYVNGEVVTSYAKGEICFETPVVDLGTYTVIAALYEDNKVAEMKTFTPREMCEGKIRLFDTTDSSAVISEVKVFTVDSATTLNKTMDVWVLR